MESSWSYYYTSGLSDSSDLGASDSDSLKKTEKPPHNSNHGEEIICHCEYIIKCSYVEKIDEDWEPDIMFFRKSCSPFVLLLYAKLSLGQLISKPKGAGWTVNTVLPRIESCDATPRVDVSTILNDIIPSLLSRCWCQVERRVLPLVKSYLIQFDAREAYRDDCELVQRINLYWAMIQRTQSKKWTSVLCSSFLFLVRSLTRWVAWVLMTVPIQWRYEGRPCNKLRHGYILPGTNLFRPESLSFMDFLILRDAFWDYPSLSCPEYPCCWNEAIQALW